jgi:hypothetical protein
MREYGMQIQINLDSSNPGDMEKFFNLLTGFGRDRVEITQSEATAAAVIAESVELAPVVEPAPEQPKRTRRTKAEIESAKAQEAEAYKAAQEIERAAQTPTQTPATPTATPLPPATEQPSAPVSIDDLRAALQGFTSAKGMPAGIELLKKFGCSRISELAAKDEATKQGFLKDATV